MAVTIDARTQGLDDILETGINLNSVNAKSTTIDMGALSNVIVDFNITTGVIGLAVLRLECSCDNTRFFDVTTDITSVGLSANYSIKTRYFRVYVQTASGSAATFNLRFNIKM